MALSWTTLRTIPRLNTYEEASKREQETKPIRGDKDGTKPLGRRDMKFLSIKREEDNSIAIRRGYNNPIVQYYPDGTITLYAGRYWVKASENDVVGALLPGICSTFNGRAWYRTGGVDTPLKTHAQGGTRFRYDEHNVLRPVDSEVGAVITHVLNRKAVKEGLAPLQRFLGVAIGMCRVRMRECPDFSEMDNVFGPRRAGMDAIDPDTWTAKRDGTRKARAEALLKLMRSDEPEDNYKAFLVMAWNMPLVGEYTQTSRGYSRLMSDKEEVWRKKLVHYLLLTDPDKYLVKKEHTDGKRRKDAYLEYVRA